MRSLAEPGSLLEALERRPMVWGSGFRRLRDDHLVVAVHRRAKVGAGEWGEGGEEGDGLEGRLDPMGGV